MKRMIMSLVALLSVSAFSSECLAATTVQRAYGKGNTQDEACRNATNKAIALAGGGIVNQKDCFDYQKIDGYTWQCLAVVKVTRQEFNTGEE
ncbi:hypothetical protein [Novosphingobium sediminicola]|uniref:Uncharacterized protein n=1 Tax=Novosphingobium sediminicola TaxID=563162 RepID=A0A7W6CTW9_9SPHN|nr:hypothetical protein [Novosphingobium sediminicola]MBB3957787.1 hypothetical protein [Novosphingobium sediminicola]